jgi:hypothetical protein
MKVLRAKQNIVYQGILYHAGRVFEADDQFADQEVELDNAQAIELPEGVSLRDAQEHIAAAEGKEVSEGERPEEGMKGQTQRQDKMSGATRTAGTEHEQGEPTTVSDVPAPEQAEEKAKESRSAESKSGETKSSEQKSGESKTQPAKSTTTKPKQ